MGINRDKPDLWKKDIAFSVDMYNSWFMQFAPREYRMTRDKVTESVEKTLKATAYMTNVKTTILQTHPEVLASLRMCMCPPLAVDRLIGLAGVSPSLVKSMEKGKIPPRCVPETLESELDKMSRLLEQMVDPDIFPWLDDKKEPSEHEIFRAATIVADRLCGSVTNPIIRNAQEKRQLQTLASWLNARGYAPLSAGKRANPAQMPPGTYAFHMNIPAHQERSEKRINISVDAVVMPRNASSGSLPLLIEAKSAGDFTNVNKRRKEEATKFAQLRHTYGESISYVLLLCGYFDSAYLGYEAAEGIDWIWEHRMEDFQKAGL